MKQEENDKNLERLLKQKAEGFEMKPSAEVWKHVQQEISREKNNRKWWLMGILLLFGLSAAGILLIQKKNSSAPIAQTEVSLLSSAVDHNKNEMAVTDENKSGVSQAREKGTKNAIETEEQQFDNQFAQQKEINKPKSNMLQGAITIENPAPTLEYHQEENKISETQTSVNQNEAYDLTHSEKEIQKENQVINAGVAEDSSVQKIIPQIITSGLPEPQENKEQIKKPVQHFYIGAQFSPEYDYRLLKSPDTSTWNQSVISQKNSTEVGAVGYSTNIFGGARINDHWSLETGIGYTNVVEKTNLHYVYALSYDSTYDTIASTFLPEVIYDTTRVNSKANYSYLQIPLCVNYEFGSAKFRGFFSARLSADFLVRQPAANVQQSFDGSAGLNYLPSTIPLINNFKIGALIGAGIKWDVTNRLSLRLQPNFKIDLSNNGLYSGVAEHRYSFGLNGGLTLSL